MAGVNNVRLGTYKSKAKSDDKDSSNSALNPFGQNAESSLMSTAYDFNNLEDRELELPPPYHLSNTNTKTINRNIMSNPTVITMQPRPQPPPLAQPQPFLVDVHEGLEDLDFLCSCGTCTPVCTPGTCLNGTCSTCGITCGTCRLGLPRLTMRVFAFVALIIGGTCVAVWLKNRQVRICPSQNMNCNRDILTYI